MKPLIKQSLRTIRILYAVSNQPGAFWGFLRNLTSDDLNDAVYLVQLLASEGDRSKNDCAYMLASWCALRLIQKTRKQH